MKSTLFSDEDTRANIEHAKQAFARSDLAQTFFHASSALAAEPRNAEARQLLDAVLARTPDALVFTRQNQAKYDFITVATGAYVRAHQGQMDEALATLCDVVAHRPDAPYLLWVEEWIGRPGVLGAIPKERALGALMNPTLVWVSDCPSPTPDDDPRLPNVRAAATLLWTLWSLYPDDPDVAFGASIVFRRSGQAEHAIRAALTAYHKRPDWKTCIAVALAYRDGGQIDQAAQTYRFALSLDPNEVSPLLDTSDMFLKAERWVDAASVAQEILAREPENGWAKGNLAFAEHKQASSPASKRALYDLAETNERAWTLYASLSEPIPHWNRFVGPADATMHAARNVVRGIESGSLQGSEGGTVTLQVTNLESPSVRTAFTMWTHAAQKRVGLTIEARNVPTPDPRAPKTQVDFVLYRYGDKVPEATLAATDPRAGQAIAAIARKAYDLDEWEPLAKALAAQMGPPWQREILAVMVSPPPPPRPGYDPFVWLYRVQVATALVLAHLDAGWAESQRKRVLYSLACGPVDWAVDAAIVALSRLARTDAAIRQDVVALFGWLESQVPKQGHTSYEHPLVCVWSALPGIDEATKARLLAKKTAIEEHEHESEEERQGGLTLAEYAELSVKRDAIVGGGNLGSAGAFAALEGGGTYPKLEALCREYGIQTRPGPAAGRLPEWDRLINSDPHVQKRYFDLMNAARLKTQGVDMNSHEGRVMQQIQSGAFDTEAARVNAQAAQQQVAQGGGGDPDPLVFPGQKLAKLSDYVGLMKGMQTGDMMGALARAGLDMGAYVQVAQAWGIKLASDPVLSEKFARMMAGR